MKWILGLFLFCSAWTSSAATLTLQNTRLGDTPKITGYNLGHFFPGSNTRDWLHYAGVNGARIFISPREIEEQDDIAGRGDGVTDQASFLGRQAALRANPLNTNYINWPYLTDRYETHTLAGANEIRVNFACSELRKLGIQIDANITASQSFLTITNATDWAGKWELWQHYYAQAFYLAREFDVQRFQMFNEPDHPNAGGLTQEDFLQRLQLASDAVQSAIADVNQIYGKTLSPLILAPVITTSSYTSWGQLVITNRHINFLNESNANFSLINKYDYHQYGATPTGFGSNLASLQNSIASAMAPEPRYPTTITEFNVHTAASFDAIPETLDSPTKYARLGGIVANLLKNFQDELYCFKFSQTIGDVGDNYPIRKNGMHFVDNTNAPYNIGGITKAGEVYRLFNKSTAPGRDLVGVTQGSGATGLNVFATRDLPAKRFHLFSANDSSSVDITLNATAWNLPAGQRVLLEEVSETIYGGAKSLLTVTNNQINAGAHALNTVWLFSIPTQAQELPQTLLATDDATVQDGANRTVNFGTTASCVVKNNSTNTSERSAAFLKFRLPTIYLPDIQFALLTMRASSLNGSSPVQAHVYGITNNNWSQSSIAWGNAPNLKQNISAGADYTNNFISGQQGAGAEIVGQIVAEATAQDRMMDVTRFIREHPARDISFLLAREIRFQNDTQDTDGLSFVSKEADASNGPRLIVIRAKDSDGDGIGDESETTLFGSNPNNPDTDGDGRSDGQEILVLGTDPGSFSPVAPLITSQPVNSNIGSGGTISLNVIAQGTRPFSFQWFFNNSNAIPGATSSSLTLTNLQTNQTGNYRVLVSNSVGFATSSNALLVVTNSPLTLLNFDPFDYAAGSFLAGQGGWLNNGANSGGTIEAGNLSVTGLFPSSKNRFTWNSPSMSLRLPLITNVTEGDVYFSFPMRVDTLGVTFISFGTLAGFTSGTSTAFGTKINIRPNGAGGFNLGVSKGAGTNFGDWATNNFVAGETVFVVGRYSFINGSVTDDLCDLWLNPGSATFGAGSSPSPTLAGQGNGGSDLSPINRFFFRAGGSTSSPSKVVADELRVGLTWASVTEPAPAVLEITLNGPAVALFWPTNPPGLFLQSSLDLNPPVNWIDSVDVPAVSGQRFTVTNSAFGDAQFYRLRK